jgi:hypothetical protein
MRHLLSMAVLVFALSAAGAQPAAAPSDGGATVSKDGTCSGQVPDANGGLGGPFMFTNDSQVV